MRIVCFNIQVLKYSEKAMAPHSSTFAWKIPWTEEPGITGKTNKQRLSTKLTLYKAYTKDYTKLRRAETKRKKKFNLEAWEEEISNTIS